MAFAYTVDSTLQNSQGKYRQVFGTYTNGSGDTGGAITTGLSTVKHFSLTSSVGAVAAGYSGIAAGVVTVVNGDNDDGVWMALGY